MAKHVRLHNEAYVVLRQCTAQAREWLDVSTASANGDAARRRADELNTLIPTWAQANPVVRIARVTITEEE
jgi:hypothetical protein